MKLSARTSSCNFIEIKVDEIEVTIFNNSTKEIEDLIENLKEVIEDLEKLKTNK